MARPKTITLREGVVTLLNFPKETSARLTAYIQAFDNVTKDMEAAEALVPEAPVEQPNYPPTTFPISDEMVEKALGYYLNDVSQQYQIVVVGYNPLTKEAAVESLEDVGAFRRDAIIEFKKIATQFNLV